MFKKYLSIENHYRQKEIDYFLMNFPELKDETYILQEKVDGSNFQIFITKHEILYGKRSGFLSDDSSFFDWQNVVVKHKLLFEDIQKTLDETSSVRLFCELYGQGIQKRVFYGKEKNIAIFDVCVNDILLSPKEAKTFLQQNNIDNLQIPTIAIVNDLKTALEYNEVFRSLLTPENYSSPNRAEGFVIKPYEKVYRKGNGEVFYIKKKNPDFKEDCVSGVPREEFLSKEEKALNFLFCSYLNENRVLSCYSKEGKIKEKKQIGKYIRIILEDAKQDFIKDHGDQLEGLEDDKLHEIFNKNAGRTILVHLEKTIMEEQTESA